MRKALSAAALCIFFLSACRLCIPAALADTITITVTGMIDNANEGIDTDIDGVFGPAGASLVGDTVSVALQFDLSHEASTALYLASNSFLPAFTEFIADSSPQAVELQTTINGTTITGWAGANSPPAISPSAINSLQIAPNGVVFWTEEAFSSQPAFFTSLNIVTGIPLPDGAVTQASPQDLTILNQSIPTESLALNDRNSVQVFAYQSGSQFAFSATPSTLSIQLVGSDLFAPEPSTAVLGLSCLTILFAARRRQHRKSGDIR